MFLKSPQTIAHSKLDENEVIQAGWSHKFLLVDDKIKAHNINCLEVRIAGLEDDDVLYEQALNLRSEIAGQLFDGRLGNAYLILVEYQALPRNRIRSYKGLFPSKGQIKKGDYLEFEFEWEGEETFFIGIVPITKDNRDEVFDLAKDWLRAFLLTSSMQTPNVYTHEFLESIINCLDIKGNIIISTKLIPRVCSQKLSIFKFGLDHGGDWVNISAFHSKDQTELLQGVLAKVVSESFLNNQIEIN